MISFPMIWSIAKRELKSLFVSPVAYVVLGLFSLGTGFFFVSSMQKFDLLLQQAQIQSQLSRNPEMLNYINLNSFLISNVTAFTFMLLLFSTPFFCMRLFTEERVNSTYELLMTSPLNIFDLVFGKYLAAIIFLFFALCTHAVFLGVMFGFGNPEVGPVISAYIGLFLTGCVFIAVGLFASTITRHQIIAVIVAMAINLALYLVSLATQAASGNLLTVLQKIAISSHFEQFNQGVIQVSSLVYFLTLIILFLAASQISVRSFARS